MRSWSAIIFLRRVDCTIYYFEVPFDNRRKILNQWEKCIQYSYLWCVNSLLWMTTIAHSYWNDSSSISSGSPSKKIFSCMPDVFQNFLYFRTFLIFENIVLHCTKCSEKRSLFFRIRHTVMSLYSIVIIPVLNNSNFYIEIAIYAITWKQPQSLTFSSALLLCFPVINDASRDPFAPTLAHRIGPVSFYWLSWR